MSEARVIRRFRFRATHRYGRAAWSEDENRHAFGDQTEPHAHDWTLELHIVGPVDPLTGFLVDLGALDEAACKLVTGWDGGDLNELVPPVREGRIQPTTEALARWIFQTLEREIQGEARLDRVRVFESPELGAEYPA